MLQHLYIINKIWAAKTNKWFLQGNKDDAITLLNYSTVSLRSFDNHYRLTSGNEENLLSILPKDRENIEFGKIENDGGCYCDLAIPQSNGVDAVDRIEFLFEKLNL